MSECDDKDFRNIWASFAVNTQYQLREERELSIVLNIECWYYESLEYIFFHRRVVVLRCKCHRTRETVPAYIASVHSLY